MSWLDPFFNRTIATYWNGALQVARSALNFAGGGVSVADDPTNGRLTITIPGGIVVQYNGSPLTGRSVVNFTGPSVTPTDDSGNSRTNVAVNGLGTVATVDDGGTFTGLRFDAALSDPTIDTAPTATTNAHGTPTVYSGQSCTGTGSTIGGGVVLLGGTGAEGGETDVVGGPATNLAGKAGDVAITAGGFLHGSPTTGSTGGSVIVDATAGDTNGHIVLRVNGDEAILLTGAGGVYLTSQNEMVLEAQTLEIESPAVTSPSALSMSVAGSMLVATVVPLGGGLDDWPQIVAAATATAYHGYVLLTPGTYSCQAPLSLPDGAWIVGSSGVRIVSTLTPSGDTASAAVFLALPGVAGTTNALNANNTIGAYTLSATTKTGLGTPSAASPIMIAIGSGNRYSHYMCSGITGTGPYTLTVDRPVLKQFTSGVDTIVAQTFPRDIVIEGNGTQISGTGDRAYEISGGWNCHISGLRVDTLNGAFTGIGGSFDVGSYWCSVRDVWMQGSSSGLGGLALESAESCTMIKCRAYGWSGSTKVGLFFADCDVCGIYECRSDGNAYGFAFDSGGSAYGSRNCVVADCVSVSNTGHGVINQNGSSGNKLMRTTSAYNGQHGLVIQGGLGNTNGMLVTDCNLDSNTGSGMNVTASQVGLIFKGVTFDANTGNAGLIAGEVVLVGCQTVNSVAGGWAPASTASLWVSRCYMESTVSGTWTAFTIACSGQVEIRDVDLKLGSSSQKAVYDHNTGSVLRDFNVRVLAVGGGTSLGYYGRSGTKYRRGSGTDLHLCTTPYTTPAGCEPSFGTFTLNGTTGVDVTFSDANIQDKERIVFHIETPAGTPGLPPSCAVTVGSKFTFTGVGASDTSVYRWCIS